MAQSAADTAAIRSVLDIFTHAASAKAVMADWVD
jgi:hypothetical protein